MNTEDLLSAFGGRVTQDNLPSVITPTDLILLNQVCEAAAVVAASVHISLETAHPDVMITRSGSLSFQVHPAIGPGEKSLVLFPLGYYSRLRLLLRLLLEFWGTDGARTPYLVMSPEDDVHPDCSGVLQPVFGEYDDDDEFWDATAHLSNEVFEASQFSKDIYWMMSLGVLFMLYHELAHVGRNHFRYRTPEALEYAARRANLRPAQFRKGLEIDADVYASKHVVFHLLCDLRRAVPDDDLQSYRESLQRLSYVVTAVLGLFDPAKKVFSQYHGLEYLHPMMRHLVFVEASTVGFRDFAPNLIDMWRSVEPMGWKACMDAYNDLSWRYVQAGKSAALLQSIVYGMGAIGHRVQDVRSESIELYEKVRIIVAEPEQ